MSFQDCLVVQKANSWWIVVGSDVETLPIDSSGEELATCVTMMAQSAGLKQFQCVLAPASNSCFFASFELPEGTDVRDRVELTYALENHLPIDAESMVADFRLVVTTTDVANQVAAVALPLEPWKTISESFESAGIPVRSIVPVALLGVGALNSRDSQTHRVDYLFDHGTTCDWIRIERGMLTDWKVLSMEMEALRQHQMLDAQKADKIVVVTADDRQQQRIEAVFGTTELGGQQLNELSLSGGEMLIKRRLSTFDLRRDLLAPPDAFRLIQAPLRCAVAATVVLLVAFIFGGWYRTQRIESEIANFHFEQRTLFKKAFPEQRVPAALLRRVRSEHARVMASRGSGGSIDLPVSARDVLVRLLSALPGDVRFRVTKIEIDNGQLDVELEVRSPVDAGSLASHLSDVGFRVKPPVTTQRDAKTFVSSLEAIWSGTPLPESPPANDSPPPADAAINNAKFSLRLGVFKGDRG